MILPPKFAVAALVIHWYRYWIAALVSGLIALALIAAHFIGLIDSIVTPFVVLFWLIGLAAVAAAIHTEEG